MQWNRQKVTNDAPTAICSAADKNTIACTKGRLPRECSPKEHVLHLPARLTKSAYQTLLNCRVFPRQWHLEGRFGSRTHAVDGERYLRGIPVLYDAKRMHELAQTSPELTELLGTDGVSIVEKDFVHNHRAKLDIPEVDARIHPELEPEGFVLPDISPICLDKGQCKCNNDAFTYAELFGGIGGFGVALDRLGGRCVFYSEIDERCRESYALNFDTQSDCMHGDIYKVPDDAFPKDLDLLVAGFPCQPFSTLGEQPGFDCDKGRGLLYLQIVRALRLSKPKAFLFENVQGLAGMEDTLNAIVKAFCEAGYRVAFEVCSARGLTATSRKRLFFVGIRKDLAKEDAAKSQSEPSSPFEASFYHFPFVPDLKLCSHDILDYDSLPTSELEVLRLSQSTWDQLSQHKRWKPADLAWPNTQCDTLTSHYGNAVGRGESQLVPSHAPHPPRRFSVRECARIMGFPNTYNFCDIRSGQGEMAHRKEGYRMVGNAVCPPLMAALAGSVLEVAGISMGEDSSSLDANWTVKGRQVAVDLARAALRPEPVPLPAGCLVHSKQS